MSLVKLNTLDRTLIINDEYQQEEQFLTHINNYGKFIFIDSKFLNKFLNFKKFYFF